MKKKIIEFMVVDIVISIVAIINIIIMYGHAFSRATKEVYSFDYSYILFIFTTLMLFAKLEIKKYIQNTKQQEGGAKEKKGAGNGMEKIDMLSKTLDIVVILISFFLMVIWKLL